MQKPAGRVPLPQVAQGPGGQEADQWHHQWLISEGGAGRKRPRGQSLGRLSWEALVGTGLWHLQVRRRQCGPGPGRSSDSWKSVSAHSLLSYQQGAKEARQQRTEPLTCEKRPFWSSMQSVSGKSSQPWCEILMLDYLFVCLFVSLL